MRLFSRFFNRQTDTEVAAPSQTHEAQPAPTREPQQVSQNAMRSVETEEELAELIASGSGFILNDLPTESSGSSSKTLHVVGCRTLRNANLNVAKLYGENIDEAVSWLGANRGTEGSDWRRCGICKPGE